MKHLPTPQPNRSRFAMVFLLFMTFLLGSVQGWGQVSNLQAFTSLYNGTSNSQNLTYSIPAGSGSNRLLIVAVTTTLQTAASNRTIALTYGGRSLTIATGDLTSNTQQHTAIYYLNEANLDLASNTTLAFTATNGTTRVNMVWAAVYDYVNQTTPLNASQNFNSGTNTTSSFQFASALSLASGNQGVVLICSDRTSNTNTRNITYPTNWAMANDQTYTTGDAIRSGVAARTIPTAAATDNCATTFSGSTLASMTGIAINGCTQPTANAGSALAAICQGQTSATLGGSTGGSATGGTWSSNVSGGTFTPNATTLNATYTPPSSYTGTVTLTLTTTGGGCGTATASKTLVVNPTPSSVTASGPTAAICSGQSINLTSSASSNSSISVTPIDQNFNTSISPWTAANASSGSTPANAAWTLRASGYGDGNETFTTSDGSQFIMSSSDAQGGGTTSSTLASASFSTTGLSAASISLNHYYRYNSGTDDRAFVEVSTDNSTWTALATYASTQGTSSLFATANVPLTAGFLNQATVYVRLRYTASFDWYWAVNSISVSGTYTSAPAATFAWTSSPAGYTSTTQNPTNVATTVSATQSTIAYTVTATNNYGCSASATTASVTLNPTPVITAASSQSFCATPTPTVGDLIASVNISGATITWYNSNSYFGGTSASGITLGNSGSSLFAGSTVGSCNSALVPVVYTINPAASATIGYAGSPFCRSVSTAQSVTLTGTTGGTYTASPAGLTINASTGAITPSTSTAGTYTVTYSVTPGGCSTFTTTASVTITTLPAATITYSGTPFCNTVTSGLVTRTGTTGGTYSSTAGLIIDASTGTINPSTSTAGTYTVTYTMASAGGCSAQTATTSVTINAPASATISYAGSPFCTSVSTAQSVTLTGTTGGTYTVSPAGLTINASTGVITPSTSTAGTYTVTYSVTPGGCSAFTTTTSVTITALPTATISYAGSPFCNTVTSGLVSITGTTGGTYSSTAGLTIDASTGTINPSTSTVGTYTLTYTMAAANGCSAQTATTSVTVNSIPTVTNASICAGGSGSLSVSSSCNDLTGQTSGPNDATVGANITGVGTLAWTNPGNIAGAGTAGMSVTANTTTNYLRGTGYGFAIPDGATIYGITVTINRSTSGTTSPLLRDNEVKLLKGGAIQTTNKAVTGTNWSGTLTSATYGSNADLWGSTWTAADINASNFGVVFSAINSNTGSARTAAVDFIRITVTYTIPGSLNWYTVSSGGSVISTGSSFNPVGVANSGLANSNTPGTTPYYVSCSTAAGACRAQANFEIKESPTATITAGSATTFCAGGSVVLNANTGTGLTYLWSNGATTSSITVSSSGSYTVTVTNANDCSATSAATVVTVNPIVTPTFTQVSGICSGASLNALPTTSNNNISGTWSPEVNNTATTEYTFTPAAGQCATTTAMTISVTPTTNFYADADGDGYGNAASTQAACSQPTGYASNNTDCNDNSSSVNPGASETCNNSDDNCNGQNDEDLATSTSSFVTACATYTWSANGTTYTTSGNYTNIDGCNTEVLHLTITTPTLTYYVDADGDNFGAGAGSLYCANPGAGYSTVNTDCNDANIAISPMANELCDGIDNDCNATTPDGLGTTTYFRDLDGDTYGNPNATTVSCQAPSGYVADNTDCDDNNATYHVINTYFEDADNDTFGNGEAVIEACFVTAGYTVNHDDCDDTNAAVNPNATEICNQIDDDCDGEINDGLTSVDYHFDGDGDGFGSGTATPLCAPTAGYVQNSADCNDNNSSVYPGATEICGNTIDEDCAAGDLAPAYYTSAQSGPWTSASTWNMSCDNNSYTAANYAPAVGYFGIVTVDAGHTVTVEVNNGQIASTRNLNINASGSLVVNGKMSVAQTMVNNGTLTVNHGASFLQSSTTAVNSGTGSYIVNMNLTGTANGSTPNGRYWYVGSPMNNTNVSNTFYNAATMTRVWEYLPTTNSWNAIINSSTGVGQGSATTMGVGIGYLYRAGANQSVTFTGTSSTFNNNITTPLSFTGTGYKFVANPYTSHVDWTAVTRTGLNVSYWIRNANNTNYESYNATSGVSNSPSGQTTRYIPAMQGFYVYAFTASSSLRIDNGDRVHSTNVLHAPMHNQIVRLNLNDGKSDDQAVVYENENASNGIEEFDTDKFIDENHHQVYFLEGTKEVSLDGLKDATAKQRVDLGIQITSAGTYTINAVELGVEEDVMLEDKFTHTFQDLKRNSSYSFTANTGTYNNRFVLHFTLNPQTETAMESVAVTEEVTEVQGVQVYTTTGQQVKVWVSNNTDFENSTVKVYDAVGNMIERKNMTSSELLLDLDTATGVYLVEVTGANKTFTKKVFIGK